MTHGQIDRSVAFHSGHPVSKNSIRSLLELIRRKASIVRQINCLNFKRHWIIKRALSKYKPSKLAFSLKNTQIRIIYSYLKNKVEHPSRLLRAISLFFMIIKHITFIHNYDLYYFYKFRLKHNITDKIVLWLILSALLFSFTLLNFFRYPTCYFKIVLYSHFKWVSFNSVIWLKAL